MAFYPPIRTRNPIVDVVVIAAGIVFAKPLGEFLRKLATREDGATQPEKVNDTEKTLS